MESLEVQVMEYHFTKHAKEKMRFYNLSEARVKRVIRHPFRVEKGIAENTIAMMQPLRLRLRRATRQGQKRKTWKQEVWVMIQKYQKSNSKEQKDNQKVKIISAWRYPGVSPKRNPIPSEILKELQSML